MPGLWNIETPLKLRELFQISPRHSSGMTDSWPSTTSRPKPSPKSLYLIRMIRYLLSYATTRTHLKLTFLWTTSLSSQPSSCRIFTMFPQTMAACLYRSFSTPSISSPVEGSEAHWVEMYARLVFGGTMETVEYRFLWLGEPAWVFRWVGEGILSTTTLLAQSKIQSKNNQRAKAKQKCGISAQLIDRRNGNACSFWSESFRAYLQSRPWSQSHGQPVRVRQDLLECKLWCVSRPKSRYQASRGSLTSHHAGKSWRGNDRAVPQSDAMRAVPFTFAAYHRW